MVHASPIKAQEFALLAGALASNSARSYSWEMNYREALGRYAAWSFSWLNEGHLPDHHRDGQALQIWGKLPLWDNTFELSAGAGPYRYFDTTTATEAVDYSNTHGWGAALSLRAAYYNRSGWIGIAQLNSVQAAGARNSTSLLFGIAYQLDGDDKPGSRERPQVRTPEIIKNELTVLIGDTILNSLDSQTSPAETVEYRRAIGRYIDGTISYFHESGHAEPRRDGMAAQLWMTRGFFDDHLMLAAGVGPYLAITHNDNVPDNPLGDGRLAALISISASYRPTGRLVTRVTWNRMVTRYNRDSDIIEVGIGVRF